MDYKLEYMTRLFKSIRNKKYESYVIQRIWHLLNDDKILFVTQQYFSLGSGKYALADLFLPQIKMVIEVDENQHEKIEQKVLDAIRQNKITAISGVKLKRIKIFKNLTESYTLSEVNQQIDKLVDEIKNSVQELGPNFKPWEGDKLMTPDYYISKGYFMVSENDYIKTIDDAAAVFGTKAKHRGYLRSAGFKVPNNPDKNVWLPSKGNKYWENELLDELTITECSKDPNKRQSHIEEKIAENETRITFFRQKDILGFNYYKFVGVFRIDASESRKKNKCVWKRVSDQYKLKQ